MRSFNVISLDNRRFIIKKLEDDQFLFTRKKETPDNILVFPEEADRLHDAGFDVFTVEPSVENPNQFVLKIFPCPSRLEKDDGYWVRRLGYMTLHLGRVDLHLDLPEPGPGATGHFVKFLEGDYLDAVREASLFIKGLQQPGFVFDFSNTFVNTISKALVN